MGWGTGNIVGGSGGLNFKVVGGTLEPSAPRENTIWVNTDAEIMSWVFRNTQPEAPAEGMVWIFTGAESPAEFNALNKNGIMVCPMSAKQLIGGQWADKTAKSYQGGAWVGWIPETALYYHGSECVPVSGGWKTRGWANESTNSNAAAATITNREDHMEVTLPDHNLGAGIVEVVKDQDLTNVDSIAVDFEVTGLYSYIVSLIAIDRNAAYMSSAKKSVKLSNNVATITRRTVTLDVSDIIGYYDIGINYISAWTGHCGGTVKVYSVIKNTAALTPGGIVPTGTLPITENGQYDVTRYAAVDVDIAQTVGAGIVDVTIQEVANG